MHLQPGVTISNSQLQSIFQCSGRGGMRRSLKSNTLVIVSDHTVSLYEDRWEGDVFHYVGMGRRDNQSLTFMQNKTLANSGSNKVEVHLFEVFKAGEYFYIGPVTLVGNPYQEDQLDEELHLRKVWVFPLKTINPRPVIPNELIALKNKAREKIAKKLSDEELAARAKHSRKKPAYRQTTTIGYDRDPYVVEYAKRWAKGICQLCDQPAPFRNKKGEPHLHTHHIQWLSRGGDDSVQNAIALCPNCHDRMHILDSPLDVAKLKIVITNHLKEPKVV